MKSVVKRLEELGMLAAEARRVVELAETVGTLTASLARLMSFEGEIGPWRTVATELEELVALLDLYEAASRLAPGVLLERLPTGWRPIVDYAAGVVRCLEYSGGRGSAAWVKVEVPMRIPPSEEDRRRLVEAVKETIRTRIEEMPVTVARAVKAVTLLLPLLAATVESLKNRIEELEKKLAELATER